MCSVWKSILTVKTSENAQINSQWFSILPVLRVLYVATHLLVICKVYTGLPPQIPLLLAKGVVRCSARSTLQDLPGNLQQFRTWEVLQKSKHILAHKSVSNVEKLSHKSDCRGRAKRK